LRAAGFSAALLRRLVDRGAIVRIERKRRPEDGGAAPAPPGNSAAFELSPDQERVLGALRNAAASRAFAPYLLFGVTGSGKTEVYLRAIGEALAAGRGAIWLVPEIGLTPVFARSLRARFGDAAVVLHSAMGDAARARAWAEMKSGRARAVIGPRSAVFAPIDDIGIFVVDEEHDASYKQEESPRYDARDAAALRAQAHGAVLLMGSATPALETWHASDEGRIVRLEMPRRIERRPLPEVEIVDLRKVPALPEEKGVPLFSGTLTRLLGEVFAKGEQAILLAPRRGYAPFLLCRACGHAFPCPNCSVSAVVHRREGGSAATADGAGRSPPVRRVRGAHLRSGQGPHAPRAPPAFPDVRSRSSVRHRAPAGSRGDHLRHGAGGVGPHRHADGRQRASFPNVTAIGVLSADTVLNLPDFRASEKAFQLIAQVAGRSGRGERPGIVLVQTFHPDDAAIRAAIAHDAAAFVRAESEFRKTFFYPPFCEMAEIVASGGKTAPPGPRGSSRRSSGRIRRSGSPRLLRLRSSESRASGVTRCSSAPGAGGRSSRASRARFPIPRRPEFRSPSMWIPETSSELASRHAPWGEGRP
jgi:primosomal protein N' (replication factor Y)